MDVWITVLVIIIIIIMVCHGSWTNSKLPGEELGTQVDESTKFGILSVVVPTKPWFISFSKVVETKKGTGCIYIYMIELLIAEFIYMP